MPTPRFKYNGITISYVQIPYVDRVYKVSMNGSTLYFKDFKFENLFNPKSFTMWGKFPERRYYPKDAKIVWKRWKLFKDKIKIRDKELDKNTNSR